METREKYFTGKKIELAPVENLVDLVWGDERPARPENLVNHLEDKYTGEATLKKYERVAKKLDKSVDKLLVSTLDDIAWLLNLRGTDINYNPVFFSYVILHLGETNRVTLYIKDSKVEHLADYFKSINVEVVPYDRIETDLKALEKGVKIGVDTKKTNSELYRLAKESAEAVVKDSIIETIKAAKNETEQKGMRACNVRDCAAIMKYFAFLEKELKKENHGLTEYTGARKMDNFRTFGDYHKGPSFDTISSIGANGAVIHYKPEENDCLDLNRDEIYLLDSGGQYLDGTTDITRCGHFGGKPVTDFQKEAYTRVLLGVLDLERIVWPSDSTIGGADMDILARMHLWEVGLDYKHGTGHGVGSFLNVHEGP